MSAHPSTEVTHAVVSMPAEARAAFVPAAEDRTALRFTLTAEHTGGAFSLAHGEFSPGAGGPPHRHTRESEAFHIVSGEMRFEVGDDTFDSGPGSVVYLPVGVPHAFRNLGDEPCRFVLVVSPAGLETFFGEAAVLAAEGAEPEEFDRLASSYGLEKADDWYRSRRIRVTGPFAFEI
jgi:quercetin dioxygenase-like cupin family protein